MALTKIINLPKQTAQALAEAATVLTSGGLVIFPTETVYGALVDATNPEAVNKLLSYKQRPVGKAISIACLNQEQAEKYVKLNHQARQLYRTLLPGPVTVISQSLNKVVPSLQSEKGTLGIRLSSYAPLNQLLLRLPFPTTATSANSSGKKTPYTIDDIIKNLSKKQLNLIDLIIDAGKLPKRPPSLVLDTTTPTPTCLRANADIEKKLATIGNTVCTNNVKETQNYARKLTEKYLPMIKKTGLIITLDGDLGAGKTTFTQGIAQALDIKQTITSPSYTYLKEYSCQNHHGNLIHLDLWAIENQSMLKALALKSYQQPGNLLVIEWYQQFADKLAFNLPMIHLTIVANPNQPEKRIINYDKNFRH